MTEEYYHNQITEAHDRLQSLKKRLALSWILTAIATATITAMAADYYYQNHPIQIKTSPFQWDLSVAESCKVDDWWEGIDPKRTYAHILSFDVRRKEGSGTATLDKDCNLTVTGDSNVVTKEAMKYIIREQIMLRRMRKQLEGY